MKKINWRQPKYIYPLVAYPFIAFVLYSVSDFFVDRPGPKGDQLEDTDYFNAKLPEASVKKGIGSKKDNVDYVFGHITDRSGVRDIKEDADSLRKKEDYASRYSEEERQSVEEQRLLDEQRKEEERRRQQEEKDALRRLQERGSLFGDGGLSMSDSERERYLAMRRSGQFAELDEQLARFRGGSSSRGGKPAADTVRQDTVRAAVDVAVSRHAVTAPGEDAGEHLVTKKVSDPSDYFFTLSVNAPEEDLVRAIVDEEVKAVDGSRVRLRLLDDIVVDGKTLKKGHCLYASLSGFSKQRVKGTVSSVLVGSELLRVSLSVYDCGDGLEGFYVPQSRFRETAQDVASGALSSNMSLSNSISDGSNDPLTRWAGTAIQNAVQRTTNAISKAIKKNRVRVKYGTQVYLINSEKKKR